MKVSHNRNGHWSIALLAASAMIMPAGSVHAQGCVVGRSCTPGSVNGNYLMPGEFEFDLNYRGFKANKHYNGTVRQVQRDTQQTYVINRQNIWNATTSYGVTRRLSVNVDIPYVKSGWSIPRPFPDPTTTPPTPLGPRYQQESEGIGDISFGAKVVLLDPVKHMDGNIAVGFGVKAPTGSNHETSLFPTNSSATAFGQVLVDQSIQPGDGGWGFPVSIEGYKSVSKLVSLYADGAYLINPANTDNLNHGRTIDPGFEAERWNENSIPDQYLYRFGVSSLVPSAKGLTVSLGWRKEGVPPKDLIGASNGFRRPGYTTSIEPALAYTHGETTWTVDVPLTLTRNRVPTQPSALRSRPGDTTFADSQLIINYSHRFNTLKGLL